MSLVVLFGLMLLNCSLDSCLVWFMVCVLDVCSFALCGCLWGLNLLVCCLVVGLGVVSG